ncbi:hypothetical protein OIU76_028214 [Salix suchowensis]|nr:hypothetical protein OIU76_028214 [Salix suchowensis]
METTGPRANNNGQKSHPLDQLALRAWVVYLLYFDLVSWQISNNEAVFWLVVPKLIREEQIKLIMTVLLLIFLFQFLPKVYHCICLMKRMQKVTGYIFGTIWWGFGLNLIAYFIASHVAGGCWYVLAIQRVASCLRQSCERRPNCDLTLACSEEVCYQFLSGAGTVGNPCFGNTTRTVRKPMCLDVNGAFNYGIYKWALPVISSNSLSVKILYPIFWGLMTLSTFGNDLEPTSHWLEVIFSICIVLSGLMLFTLLIGNIQVFLHAVMAKKRKMQLRCRDMEWWMRRRQLPSRLRQRILSRRCLCSTTWMILFLTTSVIGLSPLVFSKDEKIIREGDPVQRMEASWVTSCSHGVSAVHSSTASRPPPQPLPVSNRQKHLVSRQTVSGTSQITFRYKFANERLKRTARYYSSNWRTWAAVNIQFAWRRYRMRTRGPVIPVTESGGTERRLLQYAAMFMSIRPHDHLE